MDRADSRRIETTQDREPVFNLVTLTLLQPLIAGGSDAIPHFTRGFVRERNRDQRVQLCRVASWFEPFQKPLCQDERLAAASSGGKRDRDPACFNRSGLLLSEFGARGNSRHGGGRCNTAIR